MEETGSRGVRRAPAAVARECWVLDGNYAEWLPHRLDRAHAAARRLADAVHRRRGGQGAAPSDLRGNLRDVLQGVVEQMRLLNLAQIFRVDTKQHIDVVVFNGVVDTIDPRIGMETNYMNEDPRGAVRRSAEGALLVCEFRGDELGWKLVPSESEGFVFLGDPA